MLVKVTLSEFQVKFSCLLVQFELKLLGYMSLKNNDEAVKQLREQITRPVCY